MARGQVFTLPSAQASLIETLSKEEMDSVAVLNPNDGVVYLKLNGAAGPTPSQWDWKLPSQSYGLFPGPWISLGLYYLDQSGSGRSAELNVYDSSDKLYTPYIVAIGRAVQSAGTTMDISQGNQPQNPPAGTGRLWIDAQNNLHVLNSTGADQQEIDNNDAAGGHLTGIYPNPSIRNGVITAPMFVQQALDLRPNISIMAGDITADRGNGTGYHMFTSGGPYLGWSSAGFQFFQGAGAGQHIDFNGLIPTSIPNNSIVPAWIQQLSNALMQNPDGAIYTSTVINTALVMSGMSPSFLTLTSQSGMFLIFATVEMAHTVANANVSIHVFVDSVDQWLGVGSLPVANVSNTIHCMYYFALSPNVAHTFQLGYATSTAGTLSRGSWMTRLVVAALK
jgi:hypothetical protein